MEILRANGKRQKRYSYLLRKANTQNSTSTHDSLLNSFLDNQQGFFVLHDYSAFQGLDKSHVVYLI